MNRTGPMIRKLSSSRILQQAGWLAMAKLVQGVCSILATFFIARHLGPTTFGELSLAIAAASMVGAAGALGLEQVATREMASEQDLRSTLAVLYRVRLGGAITGSFALLAAGLFPQ